MISFYQTQWQGNFFMSSLFFPHFPFPHSPPQTQCPPYFSLILPSLTPPPSRSITPAAWSCQVFLGTWLLSLWCFSHQIWPVLPLFLLLNIIMPKTIHADDDKKSEQRNELVLIMWWWCWVVDVLPLSPLSINLQYFIYLSILIDLSI